MGKIDASMGFSVNEDGSITRTNNSLHNNQTPDFIPVSLSKFKGAFWKKILFFLYFILILGVHGAVVGFCVGIVSYNNDMDYYYMKYEEKTRESYQNMENVPYWDTPEYYYNDYKSAKTLRFVMITLMSICFIGCIFVDWKILPRIKKNYPNKKHILKCVDFVQSNLKSNYGYPYIMTDNHIGVLNTHKKKVIVPPNYDCIYWVIPQNVLCAEVNDKIFFYDVNGKELTNVPTSYYSAKISI